MWEWLFLPTLQYPGWVAEVSRGKKNIQANKQRKREESRGWSQSNQLPYPKQRRNPGWTHREITEDEWLLGIHVLISLPSPPSGHADTLRHHQ